MRFIGGKPRPMGESWAVFLKIAGSWAIEGFGQWGIFRKADGAFLGLPSVDLAALPGGLPAVVSGAGAGTSYPSVGAYCIAGPEVIRAATERILAAGAVPVRIAGDDSVPIRLLQAFDGRRIHVLQIDAQIDWPDEVQGERWGLSSTMRRASELAHVAGIVQVGQRGIGSARPGDVADAEAWGVTFVPARAMARDGIARAVAAIPAGVGVAVCLDCDALDPAIMPGVIGRTAGRLSCREVLELIAAVGEKARITTFDMVEFMPERDVDGLGAMTAAQLLASVLGLIARQSGV